MKIFTVTILPTLLPFSFSQRLNYECVDAIIIPPNIALPYTNTIPNFVNATTKLVDPITSCRFSSPDEKPASAWYYWKPSSTGLVSFSTIGISQSKNTFYEFQPAITIFEGDDCNDLTELRCTEFLYLPAFEAIAGKKYFIAISEYTTRYGYDSMSITFVVTNTPSIPPSDECKDALVIPSKISFPFSTPPVQVSLATENPNDPVIFCTESTESPTSTPFKFPISAPFVPPTSPPVIFNPGTFTSKTVWYSWMPGTGGLYDMRTDKSTAVFGLIPFVFTGIEIYKGSLCDSLTEVTCSLFGQAVRGAKLDAGIKYFIKVVTELGDHGESLILTVNPTPTSPPENDECINAIVVNPIKGDIISGDTFSATSGDVDFDFDVNSCYANESPGLWYKLSVPKAMFIDVSTGNVGTTYDSLISIVTGNQCGELKCIASNDDGFVLQGYGASSYVSFVASASTTYYILVQGSGSRDSGNFNMTVHGSLNFFALIDSKTDRFIQPIEDYAVFGYYSLPSSTLNIQTSFNDSVKSAMLTFDNPRRSICEKTAPLAVFGNNNQNYFGVTIPVGLHKVTATPYNRVNCKGRAGTTISKSFEMRECGYFYYYYDFTSNATDALSYQPIPACNINIEVFPSCGFDIGYVTFKIRSTKTNKVVRTKKELDAPYMVFGNRGQGSFQPGNYTIDLNIDGIQHSSTPFTAFDNGSCK